MGCVCGKASSSSVKDRTGDEKRRGLAKSSGSVSRRALSSRREESFRVKEKKGKGDARSGLIDKKANGSRRVRDDNFELINKNSEVIFSCSPGCGSVSKAKEGELVAAGWPAWFAAVAGEAILGWLPRKADTFERLDKIGQGTYSSVYKARDLIHNKVVALKRVRFDSADPESVKFMAREILILRRLDHPNIIKLEGLVTSRSSSSLYLVLEYMEHDLTGLASIPGVKFTEPQVKCYMQQLLSGLDHCHSHGVLHRDIKGSNLLIDDQGVLKITDFGLATFYDHEQSIPLTSRVVTLWYRPPELLLGATHYGVEIDLWSTGCILGELYAGKPIMPGRTEVEQLHKIFKLCGSPSEDYWRKAKLPHSTVFRPIQPYRRRIVESFKDLPAVAIGLMESLLSIDPEHRGTASVALKSDFFTTKPFACDPSSLPKYPPSKEIDAKLREEEYRRQVVNGGKDQPKEPRGVPALDANAEITRSLQRRKGNSKSRSEQFNNPHQAASGFPIDPPRPSRNINEPIKNHSDHFPPIISHSGPLAPGIDWSKSAKRYDDISIGSSRADLSILSRPGLPGDSKDRCVSSQFDSSNQMEMPVELLEAAVRRQDQRHYAPNFAASRHGGNGRSNRKEAAQAVLKPEWRSAMDEEINDLLHNQTWRLVPHFPSMNFIGCKWVFRTKRKADGSIERHKARLVAKGFNQVPGEDFFETFSPVIKPTTVRLLLSLALSFNWTVRQLDVHNAFLNGQLTENVYMKQSPGYIYKQFPNHVCLLQRSLYGLKQAPRAWFKRLQEFLLQTGFIPSKTDVSLFMLFSGLDRIYLLVYVDDILIIGNNPSCVTSLISKLADVFKIRDLGAPNFFLGVETVRSKGVLILS